MTTYTNSANLNLSTITLTASAKAAGAAAGTNLSTLLTAAQVKVNEVNILLGEILKIHPSTGGDAANYSALQSIKAELFP